MKKVLIVIEDAYVRQFTGAGLRREFDVLETTTGGEALKKLTEDGEILCAVVDVALEDMAASTVCEQMRQDFPHLGILLLTDAAHQMEEVTALMSGADEKLDKPFSPAAVLAKVSRLTQSDKVEDTALEQLLSSGPFILNCGTGVLQKIETTIPLTRNEYTLMRMFLAQPGHAYTAEELDNLIWGDGRLDTQRLAATVRRLRLKIEDDPKNPTFITTVWGYGYQWR